MKIFSYTLPAARHPNRNEDSHAGFQPGGCLVAGVFDGMGGHVAGDAASRTAREIVEKELSRIDAQNPPEEMAQSLAEAFQRAQEEIQKKLAHTAAGTTATVAVLRPQPDGDCELWIAQAGDSRAYLFSPRQELSALTIDNLRPAKDSRIMILDVRELPPENVQNQKLLAEVDSEKGFNDLPKFLQVAFAMRNLVNNVLMDGEPYRPLVFTGKVAKKSKILLTSDGVHDNLTDSEIREILVRHGSEEAPQKLVEAARERADDSGHFRHKDDDITAVLIEP